MRHFFSFHQRIQLLSISYFLLNCMHLSAQPFRFGGCEGPKPLHDISGLIGVKTEMVPTYNSTQEFIVRENHGDIIYRDVGNRLFRYSGKNRFISWMVSPLSRLLSPDEHILLKSNSNVFMDLSVERPQFVGFTGPKNPKHLFWNRKFLYSLVSNGGEGGHFHYWIFRSNPRLNTTMSICQIDSSQPLYLTKGSKFPEVGFHSVKDGHFYLHRVDLDPTHLLDFCRLRTEFDSELPIEGNVRAVFEYRNSKAFGISTDHPLKHFLWKDTEGCRYVNFGTTPNLVGSNHGPSFLVQSREGLSLANMQTREVIKIPHWAFKGISELNDEDVWLTAKDQVFISPTYPFNRKILLKLNFKKFANEQ